MTNTNKKVLLRERKRHTARRVVTTPSVVLTGYPPPRSWPGPGGVPSRQGTPPPAGYPPAGYPPWLDLAGYPPPCLPHGILGNVAKHYGIWVPPCGQTDGWKDRRVSKDYLPVVLRTRAVITERLMGFSFLSNTMLFFFQFSVCSVRHPQHAFGVRLDHNDGWNLSYSGDTMPCQNFVQLCE